MSELTWRQVIARRLARSHLTDPATDLVEAVRDVGLIQAQVLSAAEIGACIRTESAAVRDVERALYEERTLVKTWSIRGTLHLVPSDELPLWAAAARGLKPHWESRDWLAKHDLTPARATALFDAIEGALDGACLTRAELADAVGVDAVRSQWGELLGPLAFLGRLCFGPPRGGNVTFVRVDQWLGELRPVDPDEARRDVLRRYLKVHGPAKAEDFRRWSGFERDAVRALFDELVEVRVEGTRARLLADDDADFDREPASLCLLPQYDAYVLGFRPREHLVPERVKQRVAEDPKGRFESVTGMAPLVVDGVVTGFWRRRDDCVDVEHVLPLPGRRRGQLEAALARLREILAQ